MSVKVLQCGLALSCGLLAVCSQAATLEKRADQPFADADHVVYSLANGVPRLPVKSKVTNHGGGVINPPKVVFIFFGPSFNNAASPDYAYARTLQAYRDQLGSSVEWRHVGEYGVWYPVDLGTGTPDWFDTTTPATNMTDSRVQAEVTKYLIQPNHAYNSSTIYEVFTPATSYSSSGSSTSCGGPNLAYCAYHGSFSGSHGTTVYTIQPYPSCSGCQVPGWTAVQNEEHFVFEETLEAATDPVNGWWDGATGQGIMDKCEWTPTPYLSGGYGYQYVWSNAANACVQ